MLAQGGGVALHGGVAEAQEAVCHRVDVLEEELEELAVAVDQDGRLQRLRGQRVVADAVVPEVVDHFQCQKPARLGDQRVPVEDGTVDDLDVLRMAARLGGPAELAGLQVGQSRGDFDDFELRVAVDFRVHVADVVEDVQHQRAVSSAHLVDDQVVVGMVRELVVLHEISGYGFAVVGAKELRRCVPQLPRIVRPGRVEGVFELGVALAQEGVELGLVAHRVKVEGLARVEDDSLLGEVAIVGVIEAVCSHNGSVPAAERGHRFTFNKVSREHLHLPWPLLPCS